MAKRKAHHVRPEVNGYRYIQKDAEILESPAYRDLTTLAKCLLDEFLIIYRDNRNGELGLDVRTAAKRLNVSTNTVLNAFDDLVAHGFIVNTREEVWQKSVAREWRITFMPAKGKEPTDDWRNWKPGCPVRVTRRMRKKAIAKTTTGCRNNSDRPAADSETEGE